MVSYGSLKVVFLFLKGYSKHRIHNPSVEGLTINVSRASTIHVVLKYGTTQPCLPIMPMLYTV